MNVLAPLTNLGVTVTLTTNGTLKLTGDTASPEAVEYVKKNRSAIMAVLSLPDGCPLLIGGDCPPGCRFATKFFYRMIRTGILPDPVKGCPLKHVCGLR